jgi:hypothetical protein
MAMTIPDSVRARARALLDEEKARALVILARQHVTLTITPKAIRASKAIAAWEHIAALPEPKHPMTPLPVDAHEFAAWAVSEEEP